MIRPGRTLTTLIVGTLLALLAGCSGDSVAPAGAKAGPVPSAKATVASSTVFPLTLETQFGKVTIPRKPARVVALSQGDADAALALGVSPVGVVDWDEFGDTGLPPWASKEMTAEPETVFTYDAWHMPSERPYKQLEKLKPDLILWSAFGVEPERREEYDRIARIAPTITLLTGKDRSSGSYLNQQTRQVAKALGRVEQGEQVLADLEARFAGLRDQYPQFKGATLTLADHIDLTFMVPLEGSEEFSIFQRLGFVSTPALQEWDQNDLMPHDKYADLGLTYVDPGEMPDFDFAVMDADLVLIDPDEGILGPEWIEKAPTLKSLPATQDGRTIMIPANAYPPISLAVFRPSILSQSWALDILVPQLAEALG